MVLAMLYESWRLDVVLFEKFDQHAKEQQQQHFTEWCGVSYWKGWGWACKRQVLIYIGCSAHAFGSTSLCLRVLRLKFKRWAPNCTTPVQ